MSTQTLVGCRFRHRTHRHILVVVEQISEWRQASMRPLKCVQYRRLDKEQEPSANRTVQDFMRVFQREEQQ